MLNRIISKINKSLFSVRFRQRTNAFFILVLLHLLILNSINLFSYISLIKSDAINENNKSLIEILADNFIKTPEMEKDSSEDLNESEDALVYVVDDCFFDSNFDSYSIDNRNKNFIYKFFNGLLPIDVTTPPPKRVS